MQLLLNGGPLWGQKLKSSMGVYVFRSAPESGHRAMQLACPKSASSGLSSHVSVGLSTPRRRQLCCFATSKAPFAIALA